MSDRKARLTITVDPRLSAYADQLVAEGRAPSVSAVFNDALLEKARRDRHALDHLRETAARADQAKVSRMMAHIQAQAAALPGAGE
jgi:Arc/MetJ-type ribon-helix-helix transcriptional regulator